MLHCACSIKEAVLFLNWLLRRGELVHLEFFLMKRNFKRIQVQTPKIDCLHKNENPLEYRRKTEKGY